MNLRKFRPGDGNHLAGGVELHGARTQRNHAAVQRQIFIAQAADIAQHGRFTAVRVEHGVRQISAGAAQLGRNQIGGSRCQRSKVRQFFTLPCKNLPQQLHIGAGAGFIQRDTQLIFTIISKVYARRCCLGSYFLRSIARDKTEGIKGRGVHAGKA